MIAIDDESRKENINNKAVPDEVVVAKKVVNKPKTKDTFEASTITESVVRVPVNTNEITKFVLKDFFPHVKFIGDKETELGYSKDENSICQFFIKEYNASGNYERKWWNSARKVVNTKVLQFRSDKNMCLKNDYYGKLLDVLFESILALTLCFF